MDPKCLIGTKTEGVTNPENYKRLVEKLNYLIVT